MTFTEMLKSTFLNEETSQILDILNGVSDPEDYKSVADWVREAYNRPSRVALYMMAINEIVGGCGVESIYDNSKEDFVASYINLGDMYIPTLFYIWEECGWRLLSYSDYKEGKFSHWD